MNTQVNCQRCGQRRTLWFDFVANVAQFLCPRGCDGTWMRR